MTTTTTDSRDLDVQQLTDTIQGVFHGKDAFMGSILVAQGAVVVNDSFNVSDPTWIGNEITIPYFGMVGEFVQNSEDTAITPSQLKMTNERATVDRSSLGVEVTQWARHSAPNNEDPYQTAALQFRAAAQRRMDVLSVAEAAGTPLVKDIYSASTPAYLDWDTMIDALALMGDEEDAIVAMCVSSRTKADLRKLRDEQNRPLLLDGMRQGTLTTFAGVPLIVSDQLPLTGSTMTSPMTESGTLPDITLAGTPKGPWNLKILVVTTGTQTTHTFKFSTDGGNTYSAVMTGAASVPLIDTAADSLVGVNGTTGITATFAVGTYTAADYYTSTANIKQTSLILQKGALAFWYNRLAMGFQTHPDIMKDNVLGAMHMYHATKLYRRRNGGSRPGCVAIKHNVKNYIG